jgi:hypothetical protein
MVRISGGIKMIVGTAEVGAGYAMAPTSGGGSLVLATHGFDTYQAGWNELMTGVPTRTVTAQVVTRAAKAAGLSDELAYLAGDYADAGIPFGAGMVGMASMGSVRLTGKPAASRRAPPTAPTNAEIRTWYLDQEASIAPLNQTWIENGVPASERALRAYSTRSAARSEARRMMSNADDVRMLRARDLEKYGDPDGPSFPQLRGCPRITSPNS